jgi:hypothetical protein
MFWKNLLSLFYGQKLLNPNLMGMENVTNSSGCLSGGSSPFESTQIQLHQKTSFYISTFVRLSIHALITPHPEVLLSQDLPSDFSTRLAECLSL